MSALATASLETVRKPRHSLGVSWDRSTIDNRQFAEVDRSVVDGPDIVQGESSTLTPIQEFVFTDETDRAMSLSIDRQIREPRPQLAYALGDARLDNTDGRYTPDNTSSTTGSYILPNRPFKVAMGFEVNGRDVLRTLFWGLTTDFKEDKEGLRSEAEAFDYLYLLDKTALQADTKYINMRTDEILAELLQNVGFGSSQYELDEGLNTVGFIHYSKGTKFTKIIQDVVEAEGGYFFQSTDGQIVFQNRRFTQTTSFREAKWNIDQEEILEWDDDDSVAIINDSLVKAKPRGVVSNREIWRSSTIVTIAPSETITIFIPLSDPINALTAPESGVDYIANTKIDGTGSDITGDVTVTGTDFIDNVKLEINNANASTAYLTTLKLRGDPALVTDDIEVASTDATSQAIYDEQSIVIENDIISNESFAQSYANNFVDVYADPLRRADVLVRGVPELDLRDRIKVSDPDTGATAAYRVMRIQDIMPNSGGYLQRLTIRRITAAESGTVAIVDVSEVDGPDIVGV